MSVYVTDTHPLVWFAAGKSGRLSKKALRAFSSAARGESLIYVPPFVLWEVAILLKIGRVALQEDFGDWADHLMAQQGFALADFTVPVATVAYRYPLVDPFDAVITATAQILDLPLITKDSEITNSGLVEVYW